MLVKQQLRARAGLTYVLLLFKLGIPSVGRFKCVHLLSCGTRPVTGTQSVLIRDGDGIPFPFFVGMPVIDDSS